MARIGLIAITRPWSVILGAGLAFLACLPGLTRIELALDGRSLLPAAAPEVVLSRSIQLEFGVEDQIAVVLSATDGTSILSVTGLAEVARLSKLLAALPGVGVDRVVSLATEPGTTVFPGSFRFRTWLDPMPQSTAEVAHLAQALTKAPVYRATLLSNDDPITATAILVRVAPEAEREELCRALRTIADGYAADGLALALVGAPVAEAELGRHLLEDLFVLVPLAFLVLGMLLYFAFGTALAVVLPLIGIGAVNAALFGLLGWSGTPVHLTCLIVPVILTAIGVAESVHLLDSYHQELARRAVGERRAAWEATLGKLAGPTVGAALTTAVGFASFTFAPLPAVRALGFALALGTLLCLAGALLVLPAVLSVCGERAFRSARTERRTRLAAALGERIESLARAAARRRGRVLVGALLLLAACIAGASRVRVQDSWVDGFDPDSRIAQASAMVDERFGGTHLLRLRVAPAADTVLFTATPDTFDGRGLMAPPGVLPSQGGSFIGSRARILPASEPSARPLDLRVVGGARTGDGMRLELVHPYLEGARVNDLLPDGAPACTVEIASSGRFQQLVIVQALRDFERFLASRSELGVGAVLGPWSHLVSLHAMLSGKPDTERILLGTQQGLERAFELYERNRGARRTREVWSASFDRSLVTLLVRHASYERVGELIGAIRDYEAEHLHPLGLRVDLAGDLAESQAMITGIVHSQVASLGGSILLVALLVAIGFRSLKLGLAGILPCSLGAFATFGVMGVFAIPLGVATSMFGAMAIGVGDDHAVHWLERFRSARAAGATRIDAAARAGREAGPAIVVDGIAVAAGFGVLCFSQVPTNARLGFLLVASMLACLVATLVLLPAVLGRRASSDELSPENEPRR